MGAFLGISVWVTLATVVPGLVTIAVLFWAIVVVDANWLETLRMPLQNASDWIWAGLGVTVMIITQTLGILLEGLLIRNKWLGRASIQISMKEGIDPHGVTGFDLEPYAEYQGMYILLSELREDEDAQGHLKRCLAQFFLTLNTLISFLAGIVFITTMVMVAPDQADTSGAVYYGLFLLFLLLISFKVAKIRFQVMAKALWAARRRRLASFNEQEQAVEKGNESSHA